MPSIALLKKKMWLRDGILNFIDCKIKFILIGTELKNRLLVWFKEIIKYNKKRRRKISDSKANFGAKTGISGKHLKLCWRTLKIEW